MAGWGCWRACRDKGAEYVSVSIYIERLRVRHEESFFVGELIRESSFGKKMNKDILSFIVYFAGYLIMQMISIVLLAVVSVSRGFVGADVTNVVNIGGYVKDVISGSLVIMIVMTVVYYAVSVFLLNRKLNLD